MSFHLIGIKVSHVKAENEIFNAVRSRCRQNLQIQNVKCCLAGYVNEMFLNAFCTRNAVIFPGLTNVIIDFRRCRRRFLTSLRDHSLFMPGQGGGGGWQNPSVNITNSYDPSQERKKTA